MRRSSVKKQLESTRRSALSGGAPPKAAPSKAASSGAKLAAAWLTVIGLAVPSALPSLAAQGTDNSKSTLDSTGAVRWAPMELAFEGPQTSETADSPNAFLDYRLQVRFTAPSGAEYDVPGFYDGDGSGSGVGKTWKVRFAADEVGQWTWVASFRTGTEVAIELEVDAGVPTAFDGASGTLQVSAEGPDAEGFLARGRLEYVGAHHLRFQDGSWFLKTGANSPENLFGYSGFDNVVDQGGLPQSIVHDYAPHVADWNPGDPSVGAAGSPNGLRGLIGALNYLAEQGVNSVYFLPMNLGGDGQETAPFLSYEDTWWAKTHYDVSRLEQWNTVMEHATRRGIQLQVVLSETEEANEDWLDGGQLGVQRKLFFRELIARFGHNLGIKWNLAEENDYGTANLQFMAEHLRSVDPYDHPICVHTRVDDFSDYFALLGDVNFDATSIQYTNALGGQWTEDWRANSAGAGHPWVVDLDENGTPEAGVTDQNAVAMRKEVLYDVLFSGGGVEWYLGSHTLPLGGDQSLEDFRTRESIWRFSRFAREFLEQNLEFWKGVPADFLVTGEAPTHGGAEVLDVDGRDFAVYLPDASQGGQINLSGAPQARFQIRWYDPRQGQFAGDVAYVEGGGSVDLGAAPAFPGEDWVVLVKRVEFFTNVDQVAVVNPAPVRFYLDAGPDQAGDSYLILGSLTGTQPGVSLLGVDLPLNYDAWTLWLLENPNTPINPGFLGTLSSAGRAQAALDLAAIAVVPSLAGLTMNHAFVAGSGGAPTWASNASSLLLTP